MQHRLRLACLALVAGATLVAVPAASAGSGPGGGDPDAAAHKGNPDFELATFKLSVTGTQKTKVRNFHEPVNDCDVRNYSTGNEKVEFESKRPLKVTVFAGKGLKTPEIAYGDLENPRQGLATTARIVRHYSPNISGPARNDCPGGGDGGGKPPVPDCGERTVKPWTVRLQWHKPQKVFLEGYSVQEDPYRVCPGGAFPELVDHDFTRRKLTSVLPKNELFDEKIGKLIVHGGGEREFLLHDYEETTEVAWKVKLKRIKDRDGGRG